MKHLAPILIVLGLLVISCGEKQEEEEETVSSEKPQEERVYDDPVEVYE